MGWRMEWHGVPWGLAGHHQRTCQNPSLPYARMPSRTVRNAWATLNHLPTCCCPCFVALQTLPRLAEVLSSRELLLQCFEAAAEQDEEA